MSYSKTENSVPFCDRKQAQLCRVSGTPTVTDFSCDTTLVAICLMNKRDSVCSLLEQNIFLNVQKPFRVMYFVSPYMNSA